MDAYSMSSVRPEAPNTAADRSEDELDRELIGRIATGDRAAFKRLYEKYYDQLLRFVWRITGQIESAQEGVNDAMLVVWTKSSGFRAESKVSTWLTGIAYNKALVLARQHRRWLDRFKAAEYTDWIELRAAEPEPTSQEELAEWLEAGMQRLSPKQRAVVELTHFHGYSYEEIAQIVGCPVNTVKTRMFHARARLRETLPALARGKSKQ